MERRYGSSVSDVTEPRLTVDQLARRTGMTVRNIRAYQSRGLIPPPTLRGRTGFYGEEHVRRLELIRELQAEGFNLEAIRRLLEQGAEGTTEELLRFTQAARAPFEDEEPEVVTLDELRERWGDEADPRLLERVLELGFLRPLGEGRFEDRSPRLARAGNELRELGIPVRVALNAAATVRGHAEGVAQAYVRLFLDEVWEPFDRAGQPPERWPEVREALERLRPLAAEALLALFQLAMTEAVDRAIGRELERLGQEEPGGRRS